MVVKAPHGSKILLLACIKCWNNDPKSPSATVLQRSRNHYLYRNTDTGFLSAFKVVSSLESAFQNTSTLLKSLHRHTIYNYMMTFSESYMSLEGANCRATWCALAWWRRFGWKVHICDAGPFLTQRKEYSKGLSFEVLLMYYHLKSFYKEILYQPPGPYLQFLSVFYLSLWHTDMNGCFFNYVGS